MRFSTVVCAVLLILLSITAQENQVEARPYDAFHKRVHEKGSLIGGSAGEGDLCGENGRCLGTTNERKPSRTTRRIHSRLLWFHEDYYGPGDHKSKHH